MLRCAGVVRALQGWVVTDVERSEGEVILLCGAGVVCEAMKTGLLLAGLRINFNQRAPLAGFVTPCVAVWDRSGSISIQNSKKSWVFQVTCSSQEGGTQSLAN